MNLSPYIRPMILAGMLIFIGLLSAGSVAQSAVDNIRPVAQVCMAGQPCVGMAAANILVLNPHMEASEDSASTAAESDDTTAAAMQANQPNEPDIGQAAEVTAEEPVALIASPESEITEMAEGMSQDNDGTSEVEESETGKTSISEPEQASTVAVNEVAVISDFDVVGTYQRSCFACHGSGAAGAPLIGDTEAWEERLAKGMDEVMKNVMNGYNTMPPKGLCFECDDVALRAIVDYMIDPVQ